MAGGRSGSRARVSWPPVVVAATAHVNRLTPSVDHRPPELTSHFTTWINHVAQRIREAEEDHS